jgi:hypothetical protein
MHIEQINLKKSKKCNIFSFSFKILMKIALLRGLYATFLQGMRAFLSCCLKIYVERISILSYNIYSKKLQ